MPNLPGLTPIDDPSQRGTNTPGRLAIPDQTPAPEQLRPAASLVDTYSRPAVPDQDNALTDLARSLASFNPALEKFANVQAEDEHADLPGKIAAARLGKTPQQFADTLKADPALQDRMAQRYGMKQLGIMAADERARSIFQAYQTGGFDRDGGNLDDFINAQMAPDLKDHDKDPNFMSGYGDRITAQVASIKDDLTKYRAGRTLDQQDQSIFGGAIGNVNAGIDRSQSPAAIAATVRSTIAASGLLLNKPQAEQDKLQVKLLDNLRSRIGDDPTRAKPLADVIEQLANADRTGPDGKSIGSLFNSPVVGGSVADILKASRQEWSKQDTFAHEKDITDIEEQARAADPNFSANLDKMVAANPKRFTQPEITGMRLRFDQAVAHKQAAVAKQAAAQSEENARNNLTTQGLQAAAHGQMHMLRDETILNAQGKEVTVAAADQVKAVTDARMKQIDAWAASQPASPDVDAAVLKAKAKFFTDNPSATNDAWRSLLTTAPGGATAANMAGGNVSPVLADAYHLYRNLQAWSPNTLAAHSDEKSREFFEMAKAAQDTLHYSERDALALATRAANNKASGLQSPTISPKDFNSQVHGILGTWWGADNNDTANHQEVYAAIRKGAQGLVDGSGITWEAAIKQAAENAKQDFTIINGVSVRTSDKRVPADFGTIANRYMDAWYDAHKEDLDKLHIDRSDLSMAGIPNTTQWRIVRAGGMADMDIPDAGVDLRDIYGVVETLKHEEAVAGVEKIAQVERDRQTSFYDRTMLLKGQVDAGHAMSIGGFSPRLMTRLTARDELTKMMAHPDFAAGKNIRDQEKAAAAADEQAQQQRQEQATAAGSLDPGMPDRSRDTSESALGALLAPDLGRESLTGLNGDLRNRLAQMVGDAPASVRSALKIKSGFRDTAQQAKLYEDAKKRYGTDAAARRWVAAPGHSQHNSGKAVDLGFQSDEAGEWVHANAAKYGLTFPLGNEPWHLEMAGGRGR